MPYKIKKVGSGYKVCKKAGGKCFSKKPHPSKKAATQQLRAIMANESYDDVVNSYLKKYLIEMDIRRDPREIEGVADNPDIYDDETSEHVDVDSHEHGDNEEECEAAMQGCTCNECPACRANQHKEPHILKFYGFDK